MLLLLSFIVFIDSRCEVRKRFPSCTNESLFVDGLFVGIGRLVMHQPVVQYVNWGTTFKSRHRITNWALTWLDNRGELLLGNFSKEIKEKTSYLDFIHPDDVDRIRKYLKDNKFMPFRYAMKGEKGSFSFYRFRTKKQQWIWLKTDFRIDQDDFEPEFTCTHRAAKCNEVIAWLKHQ